MDPPKYLSIYILMYINSYINKTLSYIVWGTTFFLTHQYMDVYINKYEFIHNF